MLDPAEVVAIDDFRFTRRMPSRAAVRELLQRGLAAEGFLSATAGKRSSEYGVIGKSPAYNFGRSAVIIQKMVRCSMRLRCELRCFSGVSSPKMSRPDSLGGALSIRS
jgi:hypothetical protein